jgi:hypothetical protein
MIAYALSFRKTNGGLALRLRGKWVWLAPRVVDGVDVVDRMDVTRQMSLFGVYIKRMAG